MFEKFMTTKNGGPAILFPDGTIVGEGEACHIAYREYDRVQILVIRWGGKFPILVKRHPEGEDWWVSPEDLAPIKPVIQDKPIYTKKDGKPAMLMPDGHIFGEGDYCGTDETGAVLRIIGMEFGGDIKVKVRRDTGETGGESWWIKADKITQFENPNICIKPPLDLIPRSVYEDNERATRFMAVRGAIVNRMEMLMEVDPVWVEEYNSLLSKLNKECIIGF